MINIKIPANKYTLAVYPNLEANCEGLPIPEAYGDIHNITPVCIDTTALKYKIAKREIKAIDEIRGDGAALTVNVDYTADLANAEFTLLGTPLLSASTQYYFVIETASAVDASNHIKFCGKPTEDYAGGENYEIDAGGSWTAKDGCLMFEIFGRTAIDGEERMMVEFGYESADWHSPSWWQVLWPLKDDNARTKIAQGFQTGSEAFYVTKIQVWGELVGAPTGEISISIWDNSTPKVQVGCASSPAVSPVHDVVNFPLHGTPTELICDIQGYPNPDTTLMTNVADIIQDVYVNILGGAAADLDNLAALEAARTQALAIYLDDASMTFGDFLEKLGAGQIFKSLTNLSGKRTFQYYESGTPAGTPHLFDEHIRNFRSKRRWKAVYQKCQVKYYENPTTDEWVIKEESSDIARYLYENQKTLTVETYLKDGADAVQLAKDFLGTDGASTRRCHLQYPTRQIEFEVAGGYGFNLIPTQKIKLTMTRADYAGGSYSGTLFRILELDKNPLTGDCKIVAVLDELTY